MLSIFRKYIISLYKGDTPMPIARIKRYNGEPAIIINDTAFPPMTITVNMKSREYLKKLGEIGFKIFYLCASTNWNNPGRNGQPDGLTQTLTDFKMLMDAVPDAYVFLRLNVAPPKEWVNAHPEEMVKFSDGTHRPVVCHTVSGEPTDGMMSLCSEAWRQEALPHLDEYFDALEKTEYFDRIIGFFLCGGGTDEWYYPQMITPEDGTCADFSEPFRKEFELFLRKKYGTEEALRNAWNRPHATFEHPIIPQFNERTFIFDVDNKISNQIRYACRPDDDVSVFTGEEGREALNIGTFLNANDYTHVADFFDAWDAATANTIVHFARFIKMRYPNLLIGAFYGNYGAMHYYNNSTCTGSLTIFDSGVVDFLAGPGTYNSREPGNLTTQREMQDSFRLRNMIYVCEDDARTHRTSPWSQRGAMGLFTVDDSITVLKRDFARNICDDIQGWWFEMGMDNGDFSENCYWYNDPQILELFRRQQEIAQLAYSFDRTKKNDIALIYDTQSIHYASYYTDAIVADYYRTSDLARIGAPVDYYFHDDMARDDMPDYKLYIMINQYYLTDEEREAIYKKARRNHATVLWLYAPGFIDPNAKHKICEENVSKTVGMNVRLLKKTMYPFFKVDPKSHPILKGATRSRKYGYIDRDVHSCVWYTRTELPTPYLNPGFEIDDPDAIVLGRYCEGGKPAMAMTDKDGFVSIYCATQVVRSDLLASIAEWSGCHIFSRKDDVLFANENFVTVHAKDDGRRTICFKHPCSPYEVYEKKYYGYNVNHIDVDMYLGETKMWCVKDIGEKDQ